MDRNLPGYSAHGFIQVRILEWVSISFSMGSSQLRDQTHLLECRQILYHWTSRKAPLFSLLSSFFFSLSLSLLDLIQEMIQFSTKILPKPWSFLTNIYVWFLFSLTRRKCAQEEKDEILPLRGNLRKEPGRRWPLLSLCLVPWFREGAVSSWTEQQATPLVPLPPLSIRSEGSRCRT